MILDLLNAFLRMDLSGLKAQVDIWDVIIITAIFFVVMAGWIYDKIILGN